MKTFLSKAGMILLGFLLPIVPLILTVGGFIALDTFFGLWKAKKLGYEVTSKKLSQLISKMVLYNSAVILFFCMDKFILSDVIGIFTNIELVLTKVVALTLISIECKSINEKYSAVTGINLWDSFKLLLKRSSEVKQDIGDIVDGAKDK